MSFFFGEPPPKPTGRTKHRGLPPTMLAKAGCKACPLNSLELTLQHPKMEPTGSKRPDILILGEAPGREEDEQGRQFVGKSGQLLRPALPKGLSYRWNNSLRCRPPENRNPTDVELKCCMPKQIEDIEKYKPKVILCAGNIPLLALTGVSGVGAWRGRPIALHTKTHSCWLVATYHPAYLLRTRKEKEKKSDYEVVFEFDLKLAEQLVHKPPPDRHIFDHIDDKIEVLTTVKDIVQRLDAIPAGELTATDIETREFRPFSKNSVWLTAAVAYRDQTFAFSLSHPGRKLRPTDRQQVLDAFYRYLCRCIVYVHNASFEAEWFVSTFGKEKAYDFNLQDTMAQAFVIDERAGVLSLDDLCVIHLGIKIKQLASLNKYRLDLEPMDQVLQYNGRDARVTLALAKRQGEIIKAEKLTGVYRLQNSRHMAGVLAQTIGVRPNQPALKEFHIELSEAVAKAKDKIAGDRMVMEFEKQTGTRFKVSSNPQILKLLKQNNLVGEEQKSADETVLNGINAPIANHILEFREHEKTLKTYIVPLMSGGKQVHDDGLIHTRYNFLLTSTGRSSSSGPNLQNFPKRGGGARFRRVIRARHKHRLIAIDYGQIEYRVIGMASLDDTIIKSLTVDDMDVHMYWTERLLALYPRLVGGRKYLSDAKKVKEFRGTVKNSWTFPAFYGSSVNSIARALGLEERELDDLFEEFWDMFAGVRDWQRALGRYYRDHGYVKCLTGRRRHGPMSYNMQINSPIQGTASDIVVDGMERLSRHAVETRDFFYHPVMNVHDDLTFDMPDMPESEFEDTLEFVAKEMLSCNFKFINVPLTIEISAGDTWGDMQEIATLSTEDFGIKPPALRRN